MVVVSCDSLTVSCESVGVFVKATAPFVQNRTSLVSRGGASAPTAVSVYGGAAIAPCITWGTTYVMVFGMTSVLLPVDCVFLRLQQHRKQQQRMEAMMMERATKQMATINPMNSFVFFSHGIAETK